MSLLTVLVALVVVGVVLWLIMRIPVLDARMKSIIFYVVIAFVVIWLLRVFGFWGAMSTVRV